MAYEIPLHIWEGRLLFESETIMFGDEVTPFVYAIPGLGSPG